MKKVFIALIFLCSINNFAQTNPEKETGVWYMYNETFFDFDDEAYNQNWLGAGFAYKISKSAKLKVGYQKISVNNGGSFDRILLGIAISTNHQKKK